MAKISKFMMGGVLGALVGLFFAPKSGKELRQAILTGRRRAIMPTKEGHKPEAHTVAEPTVDLEAKLEETRQRVETELQETLAVAPVTEKVEPSETVEAAEEEVEATSGEEAERVAGEAAIETGGIEPELEAVEEAAKTEPSEEVEVDAEEIISGEAVLEVETEKAEVEIEEEVTEKEGAGEKAPETGAEAVEEAVEEPPRAETEEAGQAAADAAVEEPGTEEQELAEEDVFISLKTPAEGEPIVGEAAAAAPEADTKPAPAHIDREEMRKRIEETRARLKAKAFDSMVGGETMTHPGARERKAEPRPAMGLDEETEKAIDESLREEG